MHGVLLDIDGTLVLSNDAHAQSWVDAFRHFNYAVSFETVRPLIGMGGDKLMPTVAPGLQADSDIGKQISNYRNRLFMDHYAPKLEPAPGSRDLVLKILEKGIKPVVASSANNAQLDVLLKAAQVDDLLKTTATSDDADNSKPDPDIVHVALKKLGIPAEHTVMIGDTPYDIEAAARAGVGLIAVRCGGWKDSDLSSAMAIYDDPADLLQNFNNSPLKF